MWLFFLEKKNTKIFFNKVRDPRQQTSPKNRRKIIRRLSTKDKRKKISGEKIERKKFKLYKGYHDINNMQPTVKWVFSLLATHTRRHTKHTFPPLPRPHTSWVFVVFFSIQKRKKKRFEKVFAVDVMIRVCESVKKQESSHDRVHRFPCKPQTTTAKKYKIERERERAPPRPSHDDSEQTKFR